MRGRKDAEKKNKGNEGRNVLGYCSCLRCRRYLSNTPEEEEMNDIYKKVSKAAVR